MTIDKQKLKALTDLVKTDRRFCADENHHALADGVQALLAEIEENAMHMRAFGEVMRSQAEQIGKLKAENEALRKDAERYRWLRDKAHTADWEFIGGQTPDAGEAEIDAARAKEANLG